MKPSEIFEGENSGLRKAFDEAVGREQSPTEKILAEFDEWIKIKRTEDVDFHYGVGLWVVTEMKEFIASKIAQTLAEEKDRMRGIIEKELKLLSSAYAGLETLPEKSANLAIRDSFIRIQTINQINKNI